jgi:PAS domain S-box-containing protein
LAGPTDDAGMTAPPDGVPSAASEGERLADAALALLSCRSEDDVYDVMGDFMTLLLPDSIIIVNEATPGSDCFVTRRVRGVDESLLSKAADLVGFEIIGKESRISAALREEMLGGRLRKVPGGFPELASSEIPRSLGELGARIFRIREVFTIGVADRERTLGNMHILTRTYDTVLPAHTIESFAHQCYSALDALEKRRELAESMERSRQLVSSMTEGLALHEIILDKDGVARDYRFLEVNPAYEDITGFKADDVIGRTVLEVMPGTEPFRIERYGLVATTGVSTRFEDYAPESGRHLEVVAYSPRPGQFATLVSDITDRKRAEAGLLGLTRSLEERVDERTEELRRAIADLTVANEAKARFLRSMSHELRTPLNSVIGFSSMLAEGIPGEVNDEQRKQLAMVRNSGQHLLSLINDILDLSRIEAHQIEIRYEPVDIPDLVADVVASLRPAAAEKGLDLTFDASEPSLTLSSDRTKVRQILLNLLGNAAKFTDAGSVSLRAFRSSEHTVGFSVCDTGPGIPPEERSRVFGEFERGSRHGPMVEGTGLGLAISRGLAGSLGGSVELAENPGGGCIFTLTLPEEPGGL